MDEFRGQAIPNREKIRTNGIHLEDCFSLPSWSAVCGYQFENLVLANRSNLYPELNLKATDISLSNPLFQRANMRQRGCQVYLLIRARSRSLYPCEIKFSTEPIGRRVVDEMAEKLKRLSYPRGFSLRPVLIHVNGVEPTVKESELFDYVIDFRDLVTAR